LRCNTFHVIVIFGMKLTSTPLDQARDNLAFFFDGTAAAYEQYLSGPYQQNREARADHWDEHYRHMQEAFLDSFWAVTHEKNKKRKEMVIALCGVGFEPYGQDFDHQIVANCLAKAKSVILVDFSQNVIRRATENLLHAGVPADRIQQMHFDMTDGLSTTLDRYVAEKLDGWDTEEEFHAFADEFAELDIPALKERRLKETERAEENVSASATERLIPGGLNKKRTFALTANDEPLPIDFFSFNMVLAATGESAEVRIWDRYAEVTSSEERGALPPSNEREERRQLSKIQIYKGICRFNTQVTMDNPRRILRDNPEATVLNITDTTTIPDDERHKIVRMDDREVADAYADPPDEGMDITINEPKPVWPWRDEPDHRHEVTAYEYRLRQNGGSGTHVTNDA